MTRPARALIDLRALRHNFRRVREAAPGSRVLAVVKADAYGHGAARVAAALTDADGFAVARIEEARELRALGIDKPLIVLAGASSDEGLEAAAELDLDLVVHHESQTEALERRRGGRPVRVWLKVDTGMHRLGLRPEQVADTWRRLVRCATVAEPLRLMTHLACADEPGDESTRAQIARFMALDEAAGAETSLANSAAVLAWPAAHGDWVRPGIMLYGVSPFVGGRAETQRLRPVMTFESRLIAVNRLRAGDRVGYGGSWTCPEDMPVGVVAVGYGDGYPRHAPPGTPLLVAGTRVPLVGRVSMDLVTVDLRSRPAAAPGDPVILWGRGLPVEEIAEHVGTIGYELVTRVAPRVGRVTVDDGGDDQASKSPDASR